MWEGKEKSDPNGLVYTLFWEGANGGKSGGKWVEL
jgi:hypothetical protein